MTTKRRKLNTEIVSLRDAKTITGIVGEVMAMEREDGTPVTNKFGTQLATLEIETKDGAVKIWADAGLRGALKMARVKPGMNIEIVHTGETKHPEYDSTLQTYDIFEAGV